MGRRQLTPKGLFFLGVFTGFLMTMLTLRIFEQEQMSKITAVKNVQSYTSLLAKEILSPHNMENISLEINTNKNLVAEMALSISAVDRGNISVVPADFLKLTPPKTMAYPRPHYLSEARNPCFYADISKLKYLSKSEKAAGKRLTCLPLVYFIGVSKSGTSDFHTKLVQHQHLIEGLHKEAHFWNLNKPGTTESYTMNQYTDIYQLFASVVENCCLNNTTCNAEIFTPAPHNIRATEGTVKAQQAKLQERISRYALRDLRKRVADGGQCPLLTIDSTPRSLYDGWFWERDPLNQGLKKPKILTADRIHHFVPNAKAIVLLRNPIERVFSDFRFFGGATTKLSFLIEKGIGWWQKCISRLPERRCAFGFQYATEGIANLPGDMSWGNNGAGRLRLSMYIIYISKWLEVFPKENLLIVNSNVFDKNPLEFFKQTVYPFLGLEPLSTAAEESLQKLLNSGRIHVTKKRRLQPDKQTLKRLQELYLPYNQRLAELTGDESFLWNES